MNHDEVIKLLGAYLDGELDLTTCVKLEDHIAGCDACQQKMEAEQEMIEVVKTETPRFEASPFLKTRIRAALREEKGASASTPVSRGISMAWLWPGMAIAALVLLAFGISRTHSVPELVGEAVTNHVRSLQVNHLMDVASTDQHTVKPWFAGKLDYSPQVVDLTASGYPLIGGRLDVLEGRTVAAIIYGRRKHYINLFIWPPDSHPIPGHLYTQNGYHILGWTKAGMNYLAVSEIGDQELRDFEKLIQDQTVETRPGE